MDQLADTDAYADLRYNADTDDDTDADDSRRRYSRRATLEEQLLEGTNSSAIRIGLPRITFRPRLPQVRIRIRIRIR